VKRFTHRAFPHLYEIGGLPEGDPKSKVGAMITSQRSFQITRLRELRAAATAREVWAAVNNDTFFALTAYVRSFTGITLHGGDEDPGALKACVQTLDALEEVVAWMNKSNLVQVATKGIAGGVTYKAAEQVWDDTFANYPNKGPLLNAIKRQFLSWVSGLDDDRSGPSKLIEYAPMALSG
jgi:hypothetical protein